MLKRFASYYKPHRRLFYIDMFCALIISACNMFYPIIAKDIINVYVPERDMRRLVLWCCVLLGIYLLKAVMKFIVDYWGHIVGVRIQADMRREMFGHLEKLPISFFDENKSGVLMSRMTNDLQEISELAHHGPEDIFLSVVMLIGAVAWLSTICPPLALILLVMLPCTVFITTRARLGLNRASQETRVKMGEINANVGTAISGVRISRAYTGEDHELKLFDMLNRQLTGIRSKYYWAMARFFTEAELLMDLTYLAILFFGGLFFFRGSINAGEYTAFLLMVSNFFTPVRKMVNMFEQLQAGTTGFKRFTEIMDEPPEEDAPDAIDAGRLVGDIAFEDVSFRYKNSDAKGTEKVIKHLNLRIPAGETVALVGPSGGGKTTLCNLIPRFYDPEEGRITIDGTDIRDFTRVSLRRNVGIVAQYVFLFDGSIADNIRYGNLDATDHEVIEAARKARIHDYVMTLEEGYDTQVGERGVKLSGGQKQRISIARVFLKDPGILILDEATSALDNQTEMEIQQELFELAKGRTCIIVAHRLSTIKSANEIVVLTPSGIAERGSHRELMALGGIYANLYNYQIIDL